MRRKGKKTTFVVDAASDEGRVRVSSHSICSCKGRGDCHTVAQFLPTLTLCCVVKATPSLIKYFHGLSNKRGQTKIRILKMTEHLLNS